KKAKAQKPLVVVFGSTGKSAQGGSVANSLLTDRYRVRALTRNVNSEKAKALVAMGKKYIENALRGVKIAFNHLLYKEQKNNGVEIALPYLEEDDDVLAIINVEDVGVSNYSKILEQEHAKRIASGKRHILKTLGNEDISKLGYTMMK
ncbi:6321_t:CDS:2, partial [Funneliformis geosporum]